MATALQDGKLKLNCSTSNGGGCAQLGAVLGTSIDHNHLVPAGEVLELDIETLAGQGYAVQRLGFWVELAPTRCPFGGALLAGVGVDQQDVQPLECRHA